MAKILLLKRREDCINVWHYMFLLQIMGHFGAQIQITEAFKVTVSFVVYKKYTNKCI